jgi:hypothetical protein
MWVENARRHELEGVLLAIDDDSVACVVPTLITHDVCVLFRQQVDDLSFAFVTPLRSDNCGNFGQVWCHESEINR